MVIKVQWLGGWVGWGGARVFPRSVFLGLLKESLSILIARHEATGCHAIDGDV